MEIRDGMEMDGDTITGMVDIMDHIGVMDFTADIMAVTMVVDTTETDGTMDIMEMDIMAVEET